MLQFYLLYTFAAVVHFYIVLQYQKIAQEQIGCDPSDPACIIFAGLSGHRFVLISVFILVSAFSLSSWRGESIPIVPTTTLEDLQFAIRYFLYGGILLLIVDLNVMRHIRSSIAKKKSLTSRSIRWRVNGINYSGSALFVTSIFLIMRLLIHVS